MKIGLDIDGVLYPWADAAYEWCVNNGVTTRPKLEFFMEDINKMSDVFNYNIVRMPCIHDTFVPDKRTLDFVQRLKQKGTLYYITARPEDIRYVTEKYLQRYFPDYQNLFMTEHKEDIIIQNEIDVFVEDSSRNAIKLSKYCKSFLVTTPYNCHAVLNRETIRLNNLFELERYI